MASDLRRESWGLSCSRTPKIISFSCCHSKTTGVTDRGNSIKIVPFSKTPNNVFLYFCPGWEKVSRSHKVEPYTFDLMSVACSKTSDLSLMQLPTVNGLVSGGLCSWRNFFPFVLIAGAACCLPKHSQSLNKTRYHNLLWVFMIGVASNNIYQCEWLVSLLLNQYNKWAPKEEAVCMQWSAKQNNGISRKIGLKILMYNLEMQRRRNKDGSKLNCTTGGYKKKEGIRYSSEAARYLQIFGCSTRPYKSEQTTVIIS